MIWNITANDRKRFERRLHAVGRVVATAAAFAIARNFSAPSVRLNRRMQSRPVLSRRADRSGPPIAENPLLGV